jgi:ABC-type transport system involved in multi-copper enzyme maturation permease subunit
VSTSSALTHIRVVASFAWLEALRTRLPWIVAGMTLALFGAGLFARSLAITEAERIQAGFLATGLRLATVFVVCMHVLASMLREGQDKVTELLLSADITRGQYLSGKLLGYGLVALAVSLVISLPLALLARPAAWAAWALSLGFESLLVVAAALFCVVTFNHLMLATAFVLAFYLLSRAMAAVVLISGSALLDDGSWTYRATVVVVKAVEMALPDLDRFTRTAWLLDQAAPWTELPLLAVQTAVYGLLLFAAASFDLYRRNQ